jgi:hypothetical protein
MRVFARIEESLRRIFVQENASLGWMPDRLPSFNEPTIILPREIPYIHAGYAEFPPEIGAEVAAHLQLMPSKHGR